MPLPDLDSTTGHLPLGRYLWTLDEMRDRFVSHSDFAASTSRSEIWDRWTLAHDLLRDAVTIHSVWFGGSFTSAKINPADVDCTFVISAEAFTGLTDDERKIVESFQRRVPGALPGTMVPAHLITRVDSYVILWGPVASPDPDAMHTFGSQYVRSRGYWDDWWSRYRTSAKTAPIRREDVLPRRGYLEVMLDGFA